MRKANLTVVPGGASSASAGKKPGKAASGGKASPSKKAAKITVYEGELHGEDLRIGIVQSRFNEEICTGLRDACVEELIKLGKPDPTGN